MRGGLFTTCRRLVFPARQIGPLDTHNPVLAAGHSLAPVELFFDWQASHGANTRCYQRHADSDWSVMSIVSFQSPRGHSHSPCP